MSRPAKIKLTIPEPARKQFTIYNFWIRTITILIGFMFFIFNANGQLKQQDNYRLQIDTLSVKGDSVLNNILTFWNDTLIEEKSALLFPDSIKIPRFRLTGNLFKKQVYVYRVVKQGQTIFYSAGGNKKYTKYKDDKMVSTLYFDNNNNAISEEDFLKNNRQNGLCGEIIGEYIIREQKKK